MVHVVYIVGFALWARMFWVAGRVYERRTIEEHMRRTERERRGKPESLHNLHVVRAPAGLRTATKCEPGKHHPFCCLSQTVSFVPTGTPAATKCEPGKHHPECPFQPPVKDEEWDTRRYRKYDEDGHPVDCNCSR